MSWYKTGTVAINNGSTTVTGTGTAWVDNVDVGEGILLPDNRTYEITGVVSNTSLTIGRAYLGSNTSGQPYEIQPFRGRIADLTARVNSLLDTFQVVRDGIGAGLFPDGSAATPAFRFAGDQDTGIYRVGSNQIGIATGGALRAMVDGSGNVGLGGITDTGGWRLRMHQPNANGLLIVNTGGTGTKIQLADQDFSTTLENLSGAMLFRSGDTERMRITTGGNVGIGTTSPASRLSVAVPGGATGLSLTGDFAGGNTVTINPFIAGVSNDGFEVKVGSTTRLAISGNGNVGIGTASPNSVVNVRRDSLAGTIEGAASIILSNQASASGTYLAGGIFANTFRDITTQHIPAGIWFQRQNDEINGPAATQCSVLIGTGATSAGLSLPNARLIVSPNGHVLAGSDNAQTLGGPSNRWSVLHAGTGTINTSDEREKHWRGELNEAELRAAKRIIGELGIYQWNDAVAEKGEDGARLHFGVRAQRAFAIMEDEGLDWSRYAWACYDQWEEQTEPVMEEVTVPKTRKVMRPSTLLDPATGQPAMVEVDEAYEETEMRPTGETRVTLEAGDRYGVRPDQLAFWLIAAQAAIQAELEARLAALEAA